MGPRKKKSSGLIGLLFELSKKDKNMEHIMDPIVGPIEGLKGHCTIFNVKVKKLPTPEELRKYLLENQIPFDKILDGNPSPSIGFSYNLRDYNQNIFVNFYHPREHYY